VVVRHADVQGQKLRVLLLALEFGVGETAGDQRVGGQLDRAGQLLRVGQQPGLVLDVADSYRRGDGDPTAQVGGLGELISPVFREIKPPTMQAAALLRVYVQRF